MARAGIEPATPRFSVVAVGSGPLRVLVILLEMLIFGVSAESRLRLINYRNQKGVLVSEVLTFRGSTVTQGHGCYLLGEDNKPAGAGTPLR